MSSTISLCMNLIPLKHLSVQQFIDDEAVVNTTYESDDDSQDIEGNHIILI